MPIIVYFMIFISTEGFFSGKANWVTTKHVHGFSCTEVPYRHKTCDGYYLYTEATKFIQSTNEFKTHLKLYRDLKHYWPEEHQKLGIK